MPRWTVHLEGGPRRVNHAAVAVGHRVFSFGGYCSEEDYETLRQIDVHVFNTGMCVMVRPPPLVIRQASDIFFPCSVPTLEKTASCHWRSV